MDAAVHARSDRILRPRDLHPWRDRTVPDVFYSFHHGLDRHRAERVRNIGVVDGNCPTSDDEWEEITRCGDAAIRRWIDGQLAGRDCTVVLIGPGTAGRKWIDYEIQKSWQDGKGVLGVYIHNIESHWNGTLPRGDNPFRGLTTGNVALDSIVKCYDPPFITSSNVHHHIARNLRSWIAEAIAIRQSW